MAIVATVQDLAKQQTEELANKFAGILQSVVPDVTKSLSKTTQSFQKALLTGSNQKIQKSYGDLSKFLKTFDVSISDLGEGFRDTEKAFKSLKDQFADTDEKIKDLREKNIFAEKELFVNKKTNNLEVKAIILTDQQLFEKRKKLLEKEKNLKSKDKNYLDQIRKVQSGENVISNKQNANLLKDFQNNKNELKNIEELKKLYEGKGGLAVNLLDRFERSLEDNAPAFLVEAFRPIITMARQFQKTIGLLISGVKFIGKFLPDSVKEGFSKTMKGLGAGFKKTMTSIGGGLKKTMTSIGGGLKSFGKSIKMASLGLLGFVKRIFLAGLALLMGIITPLLPIIIPMLEFAGIVALVVAGLFLLKKGLTALTDWFRNSWLGKKLGLDKESMDKAEVKDKKEGTGKYQSLDGEMDYGDHTSNKKDKVIIEKPLMPANTGDASVAEKVAQDNKSGNETIGGKYNFQEGVLQENGKNFETRTPQKAEMIAKKIGDQVKVARNNETGNYVIVKKDMVTAERPDTKIMQGATGDIEGVTGSKQDKFKKPDTIKKDLKGEGTSSSSTTTTVVNNQPTTETKVNNATNMFTPINTSSGDSYFDRQANASNF
jgi:hypothetical protein